MDIRKKIVQPVELCSTDIFKDTEYVIPIYQRNYAWGQDQIELLLNDINDINEKSENKYYLGSLVVNKIGENRFEVIDGQQRLTTLYLLLSFLDDESVVHQQVLRFETREKSNRTLQAIDDIIEDLKEKFPKKNWYSSEIFEGYSVIKGYFKGKEKKEKKEKKEDKFRNNFKKKLKSVQIFRVQVPENIDLNHYFEVMNTRGEQLELHEIVKAKILGAIKSNDDERDKKDKMIAATIWDACAQMDTYVQMNFPVAKRESLFGNDWDTFQCKTFDDFREKFKDETVINKESLNDILKEPAKHIRANEQENKEENERFESIISFSNFVLQVNAVMNTSGKDDDSGLDDKGLIELLKNHWESYDNAKQFIYSLLKYRYLFDRYIIKREYKGRHKDDGEWSLKRLKAYTDTHNKKKPSYEGTVHNPAPTEDDGNDNKRLRLLQSCLRITYTAPKTMHWIAKALSTACEKNDGMEITKILEIYCCKKVKESDYRNASGFNIERIVFTYLDYILWRDHASDFDPKYINEFQFQFRNSIEHFFPQHPNCGEDAVTAENGVTEEIRNSFGNLALITVSANSKFSNLLPDNKVEENQGIIEQSPKLMKMAKDKDKWNNQLVQKHDEEMKGILVKEISKRRSDLMKLHYADICK